MSSWKEVSLQVKKDMCKPPPGASTIDQIAEEMELGEDRAREIIKKLVREGRAEVIKGKTLTQSGVVYNTNWYRLLEAPKKKRK